MSLHQGSFINLSNGLQGFQGFSRGGNTGHQVHWFDTPQNGSLPGRLTRFERHGTAR
jgi:hypothetical protein